MPMIDPNDPRLTAYALDELPAAERAEFENLLRSDPAARASVDDIRLTMAVLDEALAQEPLPARATVLPSAARRHWLRRLFAEQWTIWVPLGVSACFALFFWGVYLPAHNRDLDTAFRSAERARHDRVVTANQFSQLAPGEPAATATSAAAPSERAAIPTPGPGFNAGALSSIQPNYFLTAQQNPLSTFALEVETTAYTDVRRFLEAGELPPSGLVRIEELVNAFRYRYPQPAGAEPFSISADLRPAPWAAEHKLVRIALQGREHPTPATSSGAESPQEPGAVTRPLLHPTPLAQAEARQLLTEQAGAAIQTIASDVRVQVEFNPAKVLAYRLIGYENRLLKGDDFAQPGDGRAIGASHAVTALYEIIPAGTKAALPATVASPKSQHPAAGSAAATNEWLTVKLRYHTPGSEVPQAAIVPLHAGRYDDEKATDPDFQFAAAVAGFGMLLQGSPFKGGMSWDMVEKLAVSGMGADEGGYRKEFVGLVKKAHALDAATAPVPSGPAP